MASTTIVVMKTRNKVAPQAQNDIDELIAEHRPQLRSFIRNRVNDRDDAEDILQDVFYQLVKTVGTAMNPIEQVSAWLYTVARNRIINHGTKKREKLLPAYQEDTDDDTMLSGLSEILFDETSPETEYLRSLVWLELEGALAELPAEQREIFELTELEALPLKEISRATGVSVNTLSSRKHYAVLHLRKRMSELYNEIICY